MLEVLTPEEAAERLKIPRSTVIAMCAAGELVGARKAGRRWRIPSTAIDAFFGIVEREDDAGVSEREGTLAGQDLEPRALDREDRARLEGGRGSVRSARARALLASVERHAPEIADLVLFIANTGVRRGEAIALEWPRVDLKRRMILIEPSAEWQPKDNKPREIPIGRALLPMLRRRAKLGGRWVFPSSTGERFVCWPRKQFDRARAHAGHADRCALLAPPPSGGRLPGGAPKKAPATKPKCSCGAAGLRGGPHKLRHTYATHFLAKVPDLHLLAQILGHSHARTTRLYAHLLPEHLDRARDAVSFSSVSSKARS